MPHIAANGTGPARGVHSGHQALDVSMNVCSPSELALNWIELPFIQISKRASNELMGIGGWDGVSG